MTRTFQHLVVDAGPLIKNALHADLAQNFYTVPEVIGEIKDEATRSRLLGAASHPTLMIKRPSPGAVARVKAFAKLTGDAAVLSPADIMIVALVVTLEEQFNPEGAKRIRDVPMAAAEQRGAESRGKKSSTEAADANESDWSHGAWITPDTLRSARQREASLAILADGTSPEPDEDVAIGCITTDFAMQNVLLRMGLHAVGLDGYRIKQVKDWLLRCHACFWTTRQLDRRFCERCGNPTLIRTSYRLDSNGEIKLYLKRDFQYNNRGSKAPVANPQPGREGNSLLLREDQKEYQRAMRSFHRQERKSEAFSLASSSNTSAPTSNLDTIDDRLATVFGALNVRGSVKDFASSGNHLPTIGFGRRNPNQSKRKI